MNQCRNVLDEMLLLIARVEVAELVVELRPGWDGAVVSAGRESKCQERCLLSACLQTRQVYEYTGRSASLCRFTSTVDSSNFKCEIEIALPSVTFSGDYWKFNHLYTFLTTNWALSGKPFLQHHRLSGVPVVNRTSLSKSLPGPAFTMDVVVPPLSRLAEVPVSDNDVPRKACRTFFDLPLELRARVHELKFDVPAKSGLAYAIVFLRKNRTPPIQTISPKTCREVYHEAINMLYD